MTGTTTRFSGLSLKKKDRIELERRRSGGRTMDARTWRRIRVLELLDEGLSVRATAKAVGGYPREISRVGKRYLKGGLEMALSDDPRPKPPKMLDSPQEAAIVAMVCGPPPEGRARWTVRLVAEEAVERKIVDRVGRETIRIVLATHDLKPWREKNVVRPEDRQRVRRADGGRAAPVRSKVRPR
jgi:putative transposase